MAVATAAGLAAIAPSAATAAPAVVTPQNGAVLPSAPDVYRVSGFAPDPGFHDGLYFRVRKGGVGGPIVRGQSLDPLDSSTLEVPAAAAYAFDPVTGGPLGAGVTLPDGHYWLVVSQLPLSCAGYVALVYGWFCPGGDITASAGFTIDSVAPDTVIDAGTPASPTNVTTRTFTFHGSDPAPSSGVDRYECKVDDEDWAPCTSPYTTPTLPEGIRSFRVRAIDEGGNVDPTPASSTWLVDTTPPVVTITRPANRERFFLHSAVAPAFTCVDPLAGSPAGASGIASCAHAGFDTHPLGPAIFTVTGKDHAGNQTVVKHAFAIDPPRYADFVREDQPIAYYRLGDDLGAATMHDSSGHGRHGEYKNGIALRRSAAISCQRRPHPPRACELGNDPQDHAAFFPERDGYGFTNGIAAPTESYTLEAWIKPASSRDMMVLAHGGGGQLFVKDGRIALRQTQDTVHGGGPTLTPGQWWHVAASWDGHTSRLYVNGAEVASSTTANKAPSGTATLYVGYGDQAPWFHGEIDEAAYYGKAVSAHKLADHYAIGTAVDHPSAGTGLLATEGPNAHATSPAGGGLYAPTKVPDADFSCDDPDGAADVVSCTATVDGDPIAQGDPLPNGLGSHDFEITAVDQAGLEYVHSHRYTVADFATILRHDDPIAYFRMGDGTDATTMADASGHGRHGTYKNAQQSGPFGISGDDDRARSFVGESGYGFVNGLVAPRFQATLEAWVKPEDGRNQSIAGHGDAGELLVKDGRFVFRHLDQRVVAAVGPTAGSWSQVVGVWDGVELLIYVDGVLQGRQPATKRPSSSSTFYVGFGELAPWFRGAIDEVAYYGTALSADRVYQHWLADPPPVDGGPVSGPPPAAPAPSVPTPTAPSTPPSATPTPDVVPRPDVGAPAAAPPAPTAPPVPAAIGGSPAPRTFGMPPRPGSLAARKAPSRTAPCKKLKGAKRARCLKRARALAKCQSGTSASKRRACERAVRRSR